MIQVLILVLLVAGAGLLWVARRQQAALGLPAGEIVAIDDLPHRRLAHALYDPAEDLAGRPDLLLQQGRRWIPVEAKSIPAPRPPYPSHVMQLAAYCLLIDAVYGERPPWGILRYADRALRIDYTPALETRLRQVLADMRADRSAAPDRSHESAARCRACGVRAACDRALL
jgi:CRISPR-associated exonuclease Cas4